MSRPTSERTDPKPSYKAAIEDAIREWAVQQPVSVGAGIGPDEIDDLAGRVMRKVRDAGIVIGLEDGTDYAHRT